MGFRFWRRVKIAKGVTMNLSKSGASLSFGPRGAKYTIGPRGTRKTVGIPGTGLFYTTTSSYGRSDSNRNSSLRSNISPSQAADRLNLGFFRRLITSNEEQSFVDGCRELVLGNEDTAFEHLKQATHLADGSYLAGFMALKKMRIEESIRYLNLAAEKHNQLGSLFSKYGMSAFMSLPITNEVCAHVGATIRGVLLGLVEAYQQMGKFKESRDCLERLRQLEPDDVVVKLSLVEILLDSHRSDKNVYHNIVRLSEGIENKSEIHAALMLYKAKALKGLGLLDAARDELTAALRRKKNRPDELLRAIRYERALIYEQMGKKSRALNEFGKLYAEAPDYEDVAERI